MKPLVEALERRLALERAARKQAQAELAEARARLDRVVAEQEETIRARTGELRQARDEALAASSAKSAFLANMSHEIRTPLTSIIGFAELLMQPVANPVDREEALRTIIRNGRHLLDVINDILDLAKIETQQVDLEQIDLPLPLLLRDINALVSGRAAERSLAFQVQPFLPLPPVLRTDPVRLKQILLNFISNAIKFTPRGSVTLELHYDAEEPAMRFAVVDTGIGMSEAQQARLFQPFSQADLTTTRKFGGTGLGLYISHQLAGLLGGRISVQSQPQAGSRFELVMPLAAPVPRAELLTMEGDLLYWGRGDFEITSIAVPELAGRVLLAEDGADNQRLLSAFLRQAGLAVTVAANGKDAVTLALRQDFDLILMDMQMPVMDGETATRQLRASRCKTRIVALTANVMKADVQRYHEAGCNDVLAKPVDRERFYQVIGEHLGVAYEDDAQEAAFQAEMAELHQAFRAGLPAQIQGMRDALRASDWQALGRLVHVLRGTAGSFGHAHLTERATEVELALRAGHPVRAAVLCEGLLLEAAAVLRRVPA
ncbi:MAG: ATP-binding protein [Aquincola tertiaricarbonis]|uniref:ATP-binding protein n=1 Tax=Aquincola sp. J276 TaxID=2898432 RepID=UPI002150CEA3|nr:ATP-binding protein [Aquincola sp. J276]MCR5868737.1 ATP-binding protein [Aquincola sp. J276]